VSLCVGVANIHLAAAFDTVSGQRFVTAAGPFSWDEIIEVVQKLKLSSEAP